MTLEPLLNASPLIQAHAFGAMAAFVLGVIQLTAPKGTLPHKSIGVLWLALMIIVTATSAFIARPTERPATHSGRGSASSTSSPFCRYTRFTPGSVF